jgi:hypothetical protein
MKFVVLVALLFSVAGFPAWGADDRTQLLRLNAEVQDRTKAYDVAALDKLITRDFTLIGGSGRVWDRQAFLRDIGDRSAVWEVNEPEDVNVRFYNNDTALVIGVLHMRYRLNGSVHDSRVRYTDVWVRVNGNWKYAAAQATRMPQH